MEVVRTQKEISEHILKLVSELGQCARELQKPYSDKIFFAMSELMSVSNQVKLDIDKTIDGIITEVNKL